MTADPVATSAARPYEHHLRVLFVDGLLALLGWNVGHLLGEVPMDPTGKLPVAERRFLDYLGYVSTVDGGMAPLLLVETKRPGSALPRLRGGAVAATYGEVLLRGIRGERLMPPWDEWVSTLRDYLSRLHARCSRMPARVLVTDGNWLIVFVDPAGSFRVPSVGADSETVLNPDLLTSAPQDGVPIAASGGWGPRGEIT
jgi:hypothetical protein